MDISFCELIRKMGQNPHEKVENLTIRDYIALKEHVDKCLDCAEIVDGVVEKYGDAPQNSEWNKTKYN